MKQFFSNNCIFAFFKGLKYVTPMVTSLMRFGGGGGCPGGGQIRIDPNGPKRLLPRKVVNCFSFSFSRSNVDTLE